MTQEITIGSTQVERHTSRAMFPTIAPVSVAGSPSVRIFSASQVASEFNTLNDPVDEDSASIPRLDDSNARGKAWYTKTSEQVLNVLWAIIVSRAMADKFPIDYGRVFLTASPESGHTRVVLAVFTRKASAAQTIAFWNSLEPNFQRWMSIASKTQVNEFISRISPHFYWGDTYR